MSESKQNCEFLYKKLFEPELNVDSQSCCMEKIDYHDVFNVVECNSKVDKRAFLEICENNKNMEKSLMKLYCSLLYCSSNKK